MSTELLDILGELWIVQEETPLDYMSFHCGCLRGKKTLGSRRWHIEITDHLDTLGFQDGFGPMMMSHERYKGRVGCDVVVLASDDLEEVKEALGDEMFLLDGIPAVYFDETYPEETLVETAERLIERFAPKLILGISDEISSTGDIERIRIVSRIVDRMNEELR